MPGEAVITTSRAAESRPVDAGLHMRFAGANRLAKPVAIDPQPGRSHYLVGRDPRRWRTNVPHYDRIKYEDLYPGVSVMYYGVGRQLEFDLIVAAGADPGRIRMQFEGANNVHIDSNGDLVFETAGSTIRQRKPVVYQQRMGERQTVAGRYVMRGPHEVGFTIASYDTT